MRITICAAFYPPYRGGYAESVRLLAEGLVARGNAVTVVACGDAVVPRTETAGGVVVRRVPAWNPAFLHGSFPVPNPFLFWRELAAAHAGGTDAVSTQTRFFPSTFIGFLFAKARRIPVIHTERGASYAESDSFFIRSCARLADHTAGRLVCRFSDGVIGVSYAASAFARRLGARSPVTVHNGIDAGWWAKPADRTSSRGFPNIVFVGRLVHAKGVQDLLTAVAGLVPEFPSLSLSIVGDGPYRATLEARARALGMGQRAVFCGALDLPAVREALWGADIFANPSHSEGFPRSVLEAAATGLPIVATDVGGTCEIIGAEALVPAGQPYVLGEALRCLARDGDSRMRSGAASRARARSFPSDLPVEGHLSVFKACAA